MTISEHARLHLYEAARGTWDDEAATALMSALPPDRDQLATKADLAELGSATRADLAELGSATKADLAELRSDFTTDMAELRAEFAGLRADMFERFADQTRTLMLAMVSMMFSAVALAFTAAHFA